MNRSGFTTLEVVIASALIVTLVTGGAIGMRQINLLNQVAATRTSHTEMRTRILAALNDSGNCAFQLGNPVIPTPLVPPVPPLGLPVASILDPFHTILSPLPPLLVSGQPAPGVTDGLVYTMTIFFPTPGAYEPFIAANSRANPTYRYRIELEIRGNRQSMKDLGGMQGDVVGRIPLSAEFDQASGTMVSCTTHADDMDDVLVAGLVPHTVQDCLNIDGTPIPTDMGLICRVPYTVRNTPSYAGAIPACPAGWTNASPTNPNYNTTVPIDVPVTQCKNNSRVYSTGWHAMSKNAVEVASIPIQRGTGSFLQWLLGGSAFSGLVVVSVLPVLGTIIGAAVVLFLFLFSLFKKCKSDTFTFYSQVNGVGCI